MNPGELDDLLGPKAARQMVEVHGGDRPYIPNLDSWKGYERNKIIRARWREGWSLEKLEEAFPELTRKQLKRVVFAQKSDKL